MRKCGFGCNLLSSLGLFLFPALALAGPVGYQLDVTTHYQGGDVAGALMPFGSANPDTGSYTITNSGASTFTGTVGQVALAGNGGNYNFTTGILVLAPGNFVTIQVNRESSNQGGYNGPTGTVQPGVEIDINGSVTTGGPVEPIALSVLDSNIHSGVPRVSPPSGLLTDAYVLQGGDPKGFDTGDGYEESQADGHFRFFEPGAAVPLPSALWSGAALIGFVVLARFGRAQRA